MSLTQAQFAERLRGKIDSREAFDALLVEAYSGNARYIPQAGAKPGSSGYLYRMADLQPAPARSWRLPVDPTTSAHMGIPATRWWMAREALRLAHGSYLEPEGVLNAISAWATHFAVHPSSGDPMMVAYTPDPESGEKDRQLATTLSKFCRRYFPVLTDDRIRDMEAEYRALMSGEVEFLTGKDIIRGYAEGPSACMSKGAGAYETGGISPVAVYDAPGIAMAVVRDSTGKINGRCMTYVDPENPSDKRWIRNYGDASLVSRLQRNGFVRGSWAGAKLKLIPVKNSTNKFVAPYLDANGSAAASDHCTVVRANGFLRVLTPTQYNSGKFANYGACAANTSGYIVLSRDASEFFAFTCAIDGKEYTPSGTAAYILKDGKSMRVHKPNIPADWRGPFKVRQGSDWAECWAKEPNVFEHSSSEYIDNVETRTELGYVELDAARYASMNCRWVLKSQAVEVGTGRWLSQDHCVQAIRVVNGVAKMSAVELSEGKTADQMLADGSLIEVHRVGAARTFAEASTPFKVTRGGSKVVRGIHKDLRIMPDNGLEFSRNLTLRVVMEVRWYAYTNETAAQRFDNIPATNLLDRVFNDFATYYITQIPYTRRADRGGPWGPGTWNNFMNCWLHHNREWETEIPVMAPSGTHVIAGAWPTLPSYEPSNNALMRQQYMNFARLCEKILDGTVQFADSVNIQQKRRFIEMAGITRELRNRAARALGAFPFSLTDDSQLGTAANPQVQPATATAVAEMATVPAVPVTIDRFLVAE